MFKLFRLGNMKFTLLALIAVAAVAQGFVIPQLEATPGNNVIDNLVREGLEYARAYLKKNPSLTLPSVPEQTIVDTDVNLKVSVSGVTISKADDFVVKDIENDLPNLSAKFEFVAPQPQAQGQFSISGTAFGKDVSGTGTFSADLTNLDQSGSISIGLKDNGVYIRNIAVNCNLESAKFSVSGLTVSGLTEDQLNTYLNTQLLPLLKAHQAEVNEKVAEHIMKRGNEIVEGKTLKQLIDMAEGIIKQ